MSHFYYFINTVLEYCIIEYAGGDEDWGAVYATSCTIKISNSHIVHSKSYALYIEYNNGEGGFSEFTGNTISDCESHAIVISAQTVSNIASENIIETNAGKGVLISGSISSNTIWHKLSVPYYIDAGEVIYVNGAILTIEAGTIIKAGASALIEIGTDENSTLKAIGTTTAPVIFTSS